MFRRLYFLISPLIKWIYSACIYLILLKLLNLQNLRRTTWSVTLNAAYGSVCSRSCWRRLQGQTQMSVFPQDVQKLLWGSQTPAEPPRSSADPRWSEFISDLLLPTSNTRKHARGRARARQDDVEAGIWWPATCGHDRWSGFKPLMVNTFKHASGNKSQRKQSCFKTNIHIYEN